MNLSIRQVHLQYGMNTAHIKELTRLGFLSVVGGSTALRPKYLQSQVEALREGTHYVVCQACGQRAGQITTKHLRQCSQLDAHQYKAKWPGVPLLCSVVSSNKAKTDAQKKQQSETLIARFQTPEGQITRRQISEASQRLMSTEYRQVNIDRLIALNRTPEARLRSTQRIQDRWDHGSMRQIVEAWHIHNREKSLCGIAHARTCVSDKTMEKARKALNKTSKMHLRFKAAMVKAGILGFTTEGQVGPFSVDEAAYDLRIALEIDGCYWHGCSECGFPGVQATLSNDKSKDGYLKSTGWSVLRLPGHLVARKPAEALSRVSAFVAQVQKGSSC